MDLRGLGDPEDGVARELGAGGEAQLGFQAFAVRFDRRNGQVQFGGNLVCGSALADHRVDLQFAAR